MRVLLPALLLLLLALAAGCPGDIKPEDEPDGFLPLPDVGDAGGSTPDGPWVDGPLVDGPAKPDGKPKPDAQGTSCTDKGVTIKVSPAMVACKTTTVTVTAATSYSWVIVGITPATGGTKWYGGATNVGCKSGTCSWTFPNITVPCAAGPYGLQLMKDATNDDPTKGTVVATCFP